MGTEFDWTRADAMTDEEIHAAALADPDAQPTKPSDWAPEKLTPRVKVMRRALRLSVEAFSERYHIPAETVRDWEARRTQPDDVARTYLWLIARDPEVVRRVLEARTGTPVPA